MTVSILFHLITEKLTALWVHTLKKTFFRSKFLENMCEANGKIFEKSYVFLWNEKPTSPHGDGEMYNNENARYLESVHETYWQW